MISFANKTAVVTGGSRGIGKAIAGLLVELGAKVIATSTADLNLESPDSIAQFCQKLAATPKIDVLVNNAGINIIEPLDEINIENWQKVIAVNLTGPMLLMKHVGALMKKQKSGRIVNVSSIWGMHSREKRHAYSASKTGLLGLTRSAALDLAKYGVLVNAVCPGFTKTELTFSILSKEEQQSLTEDVPLGRFAEVKEIAQAVAFLCSDQNSYITGQAIVIDGGYTIT